MKTYHFFENNKEILHRLQITNYSVDENIRLKGRNGKILSIDQTDNFNVRVNISLEPKKPKFVPIDFRKLKRR